MIATCSVHTVPYAWVAQTHPGGVILTPWGSTFENSALLRLTVDQASAAVGSVVDWATFMRLRAQRPVIPAEPDDFDTIAELDRTDNEVINAYSWWQQAGRPHRDRYGITVTAEGQRVWLDDPARPVTTHDYRGSSSLASPG